MLNNKYYPLLMSILIVSVLLGLAFTFVAVQNTGGVTINLAGYTWTGVPLFVVAILSLLIGLVISWMISLVDWIANSMQLRGKEHALKKTEQDVEALRSKIHELEIENAKLRGETPHEEVVSHEDTRHHEYEPAIQEYHDRRRNWFERIRHNLSW